MALLLFLVFIVLPLLELYVIIQVGGAIGVVPVLLLLLADGFIGAALARSQGRQVWVRFNETMAAGRIPAREILDGAMIMFGGALLLSPGFITDILGIFLLIPPGTGRDARDPQALRGAHRGWASSLLCLRPDPWNRRREPQADRLCGQSRHPATSPDRAHWGRPVRPSALARL